MNWSTYEDVWIDPERVSGAPCLKGTRLPVEAIIVNFESYIEEGFAPETVAMIVSDLFPSATPERVLKLMAFVRAAEQPLTA